MQKEKLTQETMKMEQYLAHQVKNLPKEKLNDLLNEFNRLKGDAIGNPTTQAKVEFGIQYVKNFLMKL